MLPRPPHTTLPRCPVVKHNAGMQGPEPEEIARIVTAQGIATAAQEVQHLSASEKREWVRNVKEEGNKQFHEGEYERALNIYVAAAVGIDFGATPEERSAAVEQIQVPLLCNMASCALKLKRYGQVQQLCQQALSLQSTSFKAHLRMGQAQMATFEFSAARRSFQEAIKYTRNEAEQKITSSLLAKVHRQLQKRRKTVAKEHATFSGFFDDAKSQLYDEPALTCAPAPASQQNPSITRLSMDSVSSMESLGSLSPMASSCGSPGPSNASCTNELASAAASAAVHPHLTATALPMSRSRSCSNSSSGSDSNGSGAGAGATTGPPQRGAPPAGSTLATVATAAAAVGGVGGGGGSASASLLGRLVAMSPSSGRKPPAMWTLALWVVVSCVVIYIGGWGYWFLAH